MQLLPIHLCVLSILPFLFSPLLYRHPTSAGIARSIQPEEACFPRRPGLRPSSARQRRAEMGTLNGLRQLQGRVSNIDGYVSGSLGCTNTTSQAVPKTGVRPDRTCLRGLTQVRRANYLCLYDGTAPPAQSDAIMSSGARYSRTIFTDNGNGKPNDFCPNAIHTRI
jgi:hypothetical protein